MTMFTWLIGQMCLGQEQESKHRKKVLCSGLVHISLRKTLLLSRLKAARLLYKLQSSVVFSRRFLEVHTAFCWYSFAWYTV